jgi:hypothetical protein
MRTLQQSYPAVSLSSTTPAPNRRSIAALLTHHDATNRPARDTCNNEGLASVSQAFHLGLPNMYKFLNVEDRNLPGPSVGSAIQPKNISQVTSFEVETPVALACWNDRPYATLRASHSYLVADFLLTLLLHLYAALSLARARATF